MRDKKFFRPIHGYDYLYLINIDGDIWSESKMKFLKPLIRNKNKNHHYYTLCKNGERKTFRADAIVKKVFCIDYEKRKPSAKKCNQINIKNCNIMATYNSIRDAAIITGASHQHISECCNRKAKTAGGFKWEFAE